MTAPRTASDPDLELDGFVAAFEAAVATDPNADPAAFVPPADHPRHAEVVGEVARVDMEFAWGRGVVRRADDYRRRFPALANHPSVFRGVLREEARLWAAECGPDTAVIADPSSPNSMPEPGDVVAGFLVEGELGRGAFGRVYLARQADLADRPVAVKVSAKFPGEWRTLARLQHAHILPVYSVHRHGPFHVACMPYLGRVTVAELIRPAQGALPSGGQEKVSTRPIAAATDPASGPRSRVADSPIPPAVAEKAEPPANVARVGWVLELGSHLADALAHAHERGILHRDVKPANVLVTDDGQPMLLDFNLSDDPAEGPAGVGGTLRYMAPEHLASLAGGPPPDTRSDVYSLGLVLYELLAGRLPFPEPAASTVSAVRATREGTPADVRTVRPDVSSAVASILATALSPDPAQRYPSAAALRDDLQRQLTDQPLAFAPEPSIRERFAKWRRRHPRLSSWVTVTALAVAMVSVVVGGFVLRQRHFEGVAAVNHLHRLADVRSEVRAKLTAGGGPKAEYAEAAAECDAVLGDLPAPSELTWERHPLIRPLGEGDRRTTAELVTELRWLKQWADFRAGRPVNRDDLSAARSAHDRSGQLEMPDEVTDNPASARTALPALRAAARTQSGRWEYWHRLGQCEHRAGELAAARVHFQLAADLNPDSPWPHFHLGATALQEQDWKAAVAAFDRVLKLRDDVPEAYLNRAIARLQLDHLTAAIADLDHIEPHASRLTRVHFVRAIAKRQNGDMKGADADRTAGLKLEPTDALGWNARGEAKLTLTPPDVEGAVADFGRAIEADPDLWQAYQNKANALSELLARPSDAVKVLDEAVERFPDRTPSRAGRAVLLARSGKAEAARRDADAVVNADPSAITCYQAACVYLLTAKTDADRRTAIGLLRRALRTDPTWAAGMPTDPDLRSVWKSDDFRELVKAAGLLAEK